MLQRIAILRGAADLSGNLFKFLGEDKLVCLCQRTPRQWIIQRCVNLVAEHNSSFLTCRNTGISLPFRFSKMAFAYCSMCWKEKNETKSTLYFCGWAKAGLRVPRSEEHTSE